MNNHDVYSPIAILEVYVELFIISNKLWKREKENCKLLIANQFETE